MLVISRKVGQSVQIGEVTVYVTRVHGDKVGIGIQAPAEVPIRRSELAPKEKAARPAEERAVA